MRMSDYTMSIKSLFINLQNKTKHVSFRLYAFMKHKSKNNKFHKGYSPETEIQTKKIEKKNKKKQQHKSGFIYI